MPKASMMSRNSSRSPGVIWQPGSTTIFFGLRCTSSAGFFTKVSMTFATVLSQPSWNASLKSGVDT